METRYNENRAVRALIADEQRVEETRSRLRLACIFGVSCIILATQDLLAWAEVIPAQSGWLIRVTGGAWLQPLAGVVLVLVGAALAVPSFLQISARDQDRQAARRGALCSAIVAGIALLSTLETLLPSKDILIAGNGINLTKHSRQLGLVAMAFTVAGVGGFMLLRRRDVGFWTRAVPLERENEIWRMSINVELAFRGLPKNEEVYRLFQQQIDFIQAEVGARFDKLCEQLIKESADLMTIDSTARLQMDVGHVFKRYADFHRKLAEMRHNLFDLIRKLTYDAVAGVLENMLPGQRVQPELEKGLRISVSYPVLSDTRILQQRRAEWEETMRGIVSIGATTGNQIVGDWIDRAARGDITPDDMPRVIQLIRSSCERPGGKTLEIPGRTGAPALDFSPTAKELHDWLGNDQSIDDPAVAGRVRAFFAEKKLLLADCNSPELSAEQLIEWVRSYYGGILTMQSIAAALSKRRG